MRKVGYVLICLSLFGFLGCQQKQKNSLKIMTFNIRHGEGMDGVLDLSRTAKTIKTQAPDFCALQEVDNFCLRSDSIAQTVYLAQESGMKGTFGKFMDYQGGQYGMATLMKKPTTSTTVLHLPDGKHEPRTTIVHEVDISEGCNIVFANVHFDWIQGKEGISSRLNQAKALVEHINTLNKATIIAGDFNCTPNSPTMKYLAEQNFVFVHKGNDNLSFQGEEKMEIDHVIYRNSEKVKFEIKNAKLLVEPKASDHRPLIVELEVEF